MRKQFYKPGRSIDSWRRTTRVLALLACALFALGNAQAQQTGTATTAPRPNTAQPKPATTTPQAPTVQPSSAAQPQAHGAEAGLPVIAVVHRLSGWKLLEALTRSGAPVASTFDEQFVRINIVAGYVLADGRFVVARLPRADAELLDLNARLPVSSAPAATAPAPLSFVRGDGTEFKAHFVGLDASTGLSLLEAEQPLIKRAAERASVSPFVGQRVRVIAPVSAQPAANASLAETVQAATVAANDDAPTGETGTIYMSMSAARGQLRQIKRSPTGKPVALTVDVKQVSPEWTGGVVINDAGALVGIVDESDHKQARLVAADTVRAAAARVKARRASVPQPWLGARGDAVALTPLQRFVARGWPEREARLIVNRQQGVLLTEVAPGTPAARAGLRAGDVVARISRYDVRNTEEMSQLLQELGSNATANFTVLRAQTAPLDLAVRLSEAQNPALETAEAEARAAETEAKLADSEAQLCQTELRLNETEARQLQAELSTIETLLRSADEAHRAESQQHLVAAKRRLLEAQARVTAAQTRCKEARARQLESQRRLAEAEARIKAASAAHFNLPAATLLPYGIEATSMWPAAPANDDDASLRVVAVEPQSVAAQAGVQVGDTIETINEQRVRAYDWRTASETSTNTCTLGLVRGQQRLVIKISIQPKH